MNKNIYSKRIILCICVISLSSCSYEAGTSSPVFAYHNGQIEPDVLQIGTPKINEHDGRNYMKKMLDYWRDNAEGVPFSSDQSKEQRRVLAKYNGDYQRAIEDSAYWEAKKDEPYDVIGVLNVNDMDNLISAPLCDAVSRKDDYLYFYFPAEEGGSSHIHSFQLSICPSLKDVVFFEASEWDSWHTWSCALYCPDIWSKLLQSIVDNIQN